MALDTFGQLEVMGHLSFTGKLSEEEIAGTLMVRVDYLEGETARTRYFGTASIYSITPMSEQEVIESRERAAAPRRIGTAHWDSERDEYVDEEDPFR
jgi:hypothetical protein